MSCCVESFWIFFPPSLCAVDVNDETETAEGKQWHLIHTYSTAWGVLHCRFEPLYQHSCHGSSGGRALCLDYRVSWVWITPRGAPYSLVKERRVVQGVTALPLPWPLVVDTVHLVPEIQLLTCRSVHSLVCIYVAPLTFSLHARKTTLKLTAKNGEEADEWILALQDVSQPQCHCSNNIWEMFEIFAGHRFLSSYSNCDWKTGTRDDQGNQILKKDLLPTYVLLWWDIALCMLQFRNSLILSSARYYADQNRFTYHLFFRNWCIGSLFCWLEIHWSPSSSLYIQTY